MQTLRDFMRKNNQPLGKLPALGFKKGKEAITNRFDKSLIRLPQSCFISLHRYQSSHLIRGRKIDCCYRVNHKEVSCEKALHGAPAPHCQSAPENLLAGYKKVSKITNIV